MTQYLTRDQILSAADLAREEVDVTEWGGTLLAQELTAAQRSDYLAEVVAATGGKVTRGGEMVITDMNAIAHADVLLVCMGCVDKDGAPLFDRSDAEALARRSWSAVDRVASVVKRLSGLDQEAADSAEGNFPVTVNGNSVTA